MKTTTEQGGIHARLKQAVETFPYGGRRYDEKLMSLHGYIKAQGVRGVHSTLSTLRRWLSGQGTPPSYWLGLAAAYLRVDPVWLEYGKGVARVGVVTGPLPTEPEVPVVASVEVKVATPPPPTPPTPVEVSLPSPEDVHSANGATVQAYLEKTTSAEAVKAILKHEAAHPDYEGGRKTVLAAARKRLDVLTPEA